MQLMPDTSELCLSA